MPRDYQIPLWEAFDSGYKRLLAVWHRRAGKDKCCINLLARAMMQRVGTYFYFLPSFAQARRVIWNGMDSDGFRFINHIPRDLWDGPQNETEMRIRLKNGSVFQLVGSDNIDNVVGTNPIGCVFSEYSLEDPSGWEFIRPILRENGGWALFNGTPRGKANHMYKLYEMAKGNPDWWVQRLTVEDTGVMSAADIQSEREAGMDEELINQEFYCSFEGGMSGGYYVDYMRSLESEGRLTSVPHDEMLTVQTAWDLGVDDETSIIFFQESPAGEIRIIDHYRASGEGLATYLRVLRDKAQEHGYLYGDHIAPWDIQVREMGTGKSRLEVARTLGLKFKVARKLPVPDGINAVRMTLPKCWMDQKRCQHLIDSLYSYSKTWDKKERRWRDPPRRDWATHAADAMRYLAVGRRNAAVRTRRERYDGYAPARDSYSWMAA